MNQPIKKLDHSPTRNKRMRKRRICLGLLIVTAVAFGTLAVLNRNVDPTEWNGVRTGYENTK